MKRARAVPSSDGARKGRVRAMAGSFIPNFRAHDAFESVLRAHGHPAAIRELDAQPRGRRAWRRFLESLALTCKDDAVLFANHPRDKLSEYIDDVGISSTASDGAVASGFSVPPRPSDAAEDGVIVRAMMELGGGPDFACQRLRAKLEQYGRPIPQKEELVRQCAKLRTELSSVIERRHTSSAARKKEFATPDWSNLERMHVRDMRLYSSTKGRYIEGKLIAQPFTPFVGTTTILEDDSGNIVPIALYNFLPDGLHGKDSDDIAALKLPKGCTVRIAEPLYKVFRDGSRGLRVDDPSEIEVTLKETRGEDETSLLHALKVGERLVQKGMRAGACEAYIIGRQHASLAAILLSNRSQAYAKMGDWGRSLGDAAAALCLQPRYQKAWCRYRTATTHLTADILMTEEKTRYILERALLSGCSDRQSKISSVGQTALGLKREGNAAFRSCNYSEAAGCYSAALHISGEMPRALLAGWASSCLATGAHLDALAAAAASLRIDFDGMGVIRVAQALMQLGEIELCRIVLTKQHCLPKEDFFYHYRREILRCTGDLFEYLKRCDYSQPKPFPPPTYLPSWRGDIEVLRTRDKGLGIRTKSDLHRGQVVLIEPPLTSASSCGTDVVFNYQGSELRKSTDECIVPNSVVRAQHEAVLCTIMDRLDDGVSARADMPPLSAFLPNLASSQALLPSHDAYAGENVQLSAERIASIISTNSFGRTCGDNFSRDHDSRLYAVLSLFNHSSKNTCSWEELGGCGVVYTICAVKAGEELTISYHHSEEILRRQWGIDE